MKKIRIQAHSYFSTIYWALQRKGAKIMYGTVKKFIDEKGYGWITPDNGGHDFFVHFSAIVGVGHRTLLDGQRVYFDESYNEKGPCAMNVMVVNEDEPVREGDNE